MNIYRYFDSYIGNYNKYTNNYMIKKGNMYKDTTKYWS